MESRIKVRDISERIQEEEEEEEEEDTDTLEESPISFQLSRPNERLSRNDQSGEESASSGDSTMHSPCWKPRRRLTRKEKGKKKMPEYGSETDELDQRESDFEMSEDGPSKAKSASARKASTSANEKLRRSTHQKTPVV